MGALAIMAAACNQTPTPGVSRGEALFDTCAPCHGDAGQGMAHLGAPNIAGLPRWYVEAQLDKFQAAHRGYDAWDTTGIRMKSMSRALDLPGDVASVAEYVANLPRVPSPSTLQTGDPEAGRASFQTCIACHGAQGEGNQTVNGPPLAGQSDWYLLSQLQKFKSGLRGTNPADVSGATMRPNALMLDEQAMANVVAYIGTLQQGQGASE